MLSIQPMDFSVLGLLPTVAVIEVDALSGQRLGQGQRGLDRGQVQDRVLHKEPGDVLIGGHPRSGP